MIAHSKAKKKWYSFCTLRLTYKSKQLVFCFCLIRAKLEEINKLLLKLFTNMLHQMLDKFKTNGQTVFEFLIFYFNLKKFPK